MCACTKFNCRYAAKTTATLHFYYYDFLLSLQFKIGKEETMLRNSIIVLTLIACLAAAGLPQSQGQSTSTPAKNDYSKTEAWLCRPGRQDACAVDLTTTIVAANGKLTEEKWQANPNAPIDCFYVYPTVSNDPTPNSDMTADPAELNVIKQQFARFASQCRPYAPLYRQITLAGLRRVLAAGGGGTSLDHGVQY